MSDANTALLAFAIETALGTAPSPLDLKRLRFTKETLTHDKMTVESQVIRDDRQIDETVQVGVEAKGNIDFELAIGDFDAFLEAALFSSFADVGGVPTLQNGTTRRSFVLEKKFLATTLVSFQGMCVDQLTLNLNSRQIVTGTLQFLGKKGVSAASSIGGFARQTLTATANFADTETVTVGGKTYAFQDVLTNVANNVKVGANLQASLANLAAAINAGAGSGVAYAAATTANANVGATSTATTLVATALVSGTAGNSIACTETCANAAWGAATLANGGYQAADTGLIVSASTNVANILVNGAPVSSVKSLTLTIGNSLRANDVIGLVGLDDIGVGSCKVSGKMDAYLRDRTLLDAYINHENISLSFEVSREAADAVAGDHIGYRFTIPKFTLPKGMPNIPGRDQDVMLPLEFTAQAGDDGYTIQVEKLLKA